MRPLPLFQERATASLKDLPQEWMTFEASENVATLQAPDNRRKMLRLKAKTKRLYLRSPVSTNRRVMLTPAVALELLRRELQQCVHAAAPMYVLQSLIQWKTGHQDMPRLFSPHSGPALDLPKSLKIDWNCYTDAATGKGHQKLSSHNSHTDAIWCHLLLVCSGSDMASCGVATGNKPQGGCVAKHQTIHRSNSELTTAQTNTCTQL